MANIGSSVQKFGKYQSYIFVVSLRMHRTLINQNLGVSYSLMKNTSMDLKRPSEFAIVSEKTHEKPNN